MTVFQRFAAANRPHRTLRNFVVHPKDKVNDEEKTELIYHVPCKNYCSSYIGETGRKKSAITDHAVDENYNYVIDWDKAKVVDREAQRQTRWIKEALWTRKTPMCMNRDAGSYQLSHT